MNFTTSGFFYNHVAKRLKFAMLTTNPTILVKRLSALLLVMLFVAVQVIKTGHTHDTGFEKNHAAIEKNGFSKLTHSCPICDYNFAKDNDHDYRTFALKVPAIILQDHLLKASMLVTSICTAASGRGPPANC